nr:MAG TPA: hypothetical protein [Caudoviricetes sp.]
MEFARDKGLDLWAFCVKTTFNQRFLYYRSE